MSNGATNPLKSADDVRVFCEVHRAEYAANMHNQDGINKRLEDGMKGLDVRQGRTENHRSKMGGVYLAVGAAIAVALQLATLLLES